MNSASWRRIPRIDKARLSAVRLQAHYATQWLARAARAYVPARPDDGHTNLGWDDALGGLVTHSLPDGARLGLKIGELTLVFLGAAGGASDALALDGRRNADVRAWLGPLVGARGLDAGALDAPLPYAMPAHAIASGGTYAAAGLGEPLRALASWFSNANEVLCTTREQLVAHQLEVPAVRCWPHHFDLDTLVAVAPGRTVGVGFEPGDEYYDEPYFYVSLYPAPDVASLPSLPALGHWHKKNFTAAIAPADRIVEAKDQGAEVEAFLQTAVEVAVKTLK